MHLHDRLRPGLDRISAPAPTPTAHLTKSEGRMSESKFVILGGGMVAGYSAWSNRFEAGRVGNSMGGYRPWNHPASQIMDVSEFCTWSVHGSQSRASRNNQLGEAELLP